MKPKKGIDVTICTSLSKTTKIYTNDYTVRKEVNEDTGEVEPIIDIYDCNLIKEVRNQLVLPQDAYKALERIYNKLKEFDDELLNPLTLQLGYIINDLKDWEENEMVVIPE